MCPEAPPGHGPLLNAYHRHNPHRQVFRAAAQAQPAAMPNYAVEEEEEETAGMDVEEQQEQG